MNLDSKASLCRRSCDCVRNSLDLRGKIRLVAVCSLLGVVDLGEGSFEFRRGRARLAKNTDLLEVLDGIAQILPAN